MRLKIKLKSKGRLARNFFGFILVLGLFLLPSLVSGFEISLLWSAGLDRSSFSLVNRSLTSWIEKMKREATNQNWEAEKISSPYLRYGYEMEIGLQIALTSKWSLSFSSGFLYFELTEKKTSILIKRENGAFYYAHPVKATAIPVSLNLTYFLPITNNLRFSIKGGAGVLMARYIDREANRKETDLKFVYPIYQNASATSPFMLISAGFSFQSEASTAFFIEAVYRMAKVNNLEGVNKAGQKGSLEFYEDYLPSLDFWQARLTIVTTELNPELIRNRQKSVIDFSGFSIKIGVSVKL